MVFERDEPTDGAVAAADQDVRRASTLPATGNDTRAALLAALAAVAAGGALLRRTRA